MKITIVGAGRVGMHLAKYLSAEHQDIIIVDEDAGKLSALDADFNLMTVAGNPTGFRTLREARAAEADLFIAVTPVTAENIVACATARSMGARRTVARVDRYDYIDARNSAVVKGMGVDKVIFPEFLAAQSIIGALDHSWATHWYEFDHGEIIMIGVELGGEAPIAGLPLRELSSISGAFHVSAVRRDHATIIPRGDYRPQSGDVVFVTTTRGGVEKVMELTGKWNREIRRVVVAGGNLIAELVGLEAPKRYDITIIEKDAERCRYLARKCGRCSIINGDAGENDVLIEAGIAAADAFIALSDGAAGNILACLTASEVGVAKTIAEIEREQYIAKAETFGIGTIINKQLIASNTIFQMMIDADSSSSKCLALTDAEVARLEVRDGSFLTSGAVRELRLPSELTFAGMIRGGKGVLVTGDTRFKPHDQVLVFCLGGALHKVEKLFNR